MNEPGKSGAFRESPAWRREPQDFCCSSAAEGMAAVPSRPVPAPWLSQLPSCASRTALRSLLVAQEQESGD